MKGTAVNDSTKRNLPAVVSMNLHGSLLGEWYRDYTSKQAKKFENLETVNRGNTINLSYDAVSLFNTYSPALGWKHIKGWLSTRIVKNNIYGDSPAIHQGVGLGLSQVYMTGKGTSTNPYRLVTAYHELLHHTDASDVSYTNINNLLPVVFISKSLYQINSNGDIVKK